VALTSPAWEAGKTGIVSETRPLRYPHGKRAKHLAQHLAELDDLAEVGAPDGMALEELAVTPDEHAPISPIAPATTAILRAVPWAARLTVLRG